LYRVRVARLSHGHPTTTARVVNSASTGAAAHAINVHTHTLSKHMYSAAQSTASTHSDTEALAAIVSGTNRRAGRNCTTDATMPVPAAASSAATRSGVMSFQVAPGRTATTAPPRKATTNAITRG